MFDPRDQVALVTGSTKGNAGAAVLLATRAGAFAIGQTLLVDGGGTLVAP